MNEVKRKPKPCSLRMDAELFDIFEEFCQETLLSKTAVIEEGIKHFMAEYKAKMMPEQSEVQQ